MLPIHDDQSRVVAFVGRKHPADTNPAAPKYVNSPTKLITIDELRTRMPDLRARATCATKSKPSTRKPRTAVPTSNSPRT